MSSIYDWSLTAADNDDADSGINWLENQLPNTVNNSARAMMMRVAELLKDMGGSIAAGGTANALTVTAASSFTALMDGLIVSFKATLSNTSATTTIAVNGLGSKPIRKQGLGGDIAISPNDIRQNGVYRLIYSTAANSGTGAWMLDGGTGGFESGTRLLFQQTTAPTGWTKDNSHNDKALRIVSGTVGTGGSVAFTSAFASQNVGSTALTVAQMPLHGHSVSGATNTEGQNHTHSITVNGTTSSSGGFTVVGLPNSPTGADGGPGRAVGNGGTQVVPGHTHTFGFTGSTSIEDSSHTHTFTAAASSTGSGESHTHSLNIAVQYVDVILASKD